MAAILPDNMSASSPADNEDFSSASSAGAAGAQPVLDQMNPRTVANNDFAQVDGVCHPCQGPRHNEVCVNIVEGYTNIVQKGGKTCSVEGCAKLARGGQGVCIRHGAKVTTKTCSVAGCSKLARGGQGVCIKHGAKVKTKTCSVEGCAKLARHGQGVCISHGAKVERKMCSVEGCDNYVQRGCVCMRHGAKVKTCSVEGCTNNAKMGSVCIRHGAKNKRCSVEGCINKVQKGGVCIRHGAKVKKKTCSIEGCKNIVVKGGVCWRHGAKVEKKTCSVEGCANIVVNEDYKCGKKRKKIVWQCDVCKEARFDDYDECAAHERACALGRRANGRARTTVAAVEGEDGKRTAPAATVTIHGKGANNCGNPNSFAA